MNPKRLIVNLVATFVICAGALFMGVPQALASQTCSNGDFTVITPGECSCNSTSCTCELPCTIIFEMAAE